jgi:hypothetical protein
MIVVVPDAHALSVDTTLSTIQALLFARLLAERIASKGRPQPIADDQFITSQSDL